MKTRDASYAVRRTSSSRPLSGGDGAGNAAGISLRTWVPLMLLFGTLAVLYIGYALRMQERVARLSDMEQDLARIRREHKEVKLRYDRLTGPNEIYRQAKEMGFVGSGPADVILPWEVEP